MSENTNGENEYVDDVTPDEAGAEVAADFVEGSDEELVSASASGETAESPAVDDVVASPEVDETVVEAVADEIAEAVENTGFAPVGAGEPEPVSPSSAFEVPEEFVTEAPQVVPPAFAPAVPAAASPADTGDAAAYKAATHAAPVDLGPRRVRLSVARVDPLSVGKLALLLSFALGIMMVVATAVLWNVLDSMHVFTNINDMIISVTGEGSTVNILDYLDFSKVMSYVTLIAIVDLFLLTALATLGAFLYNITASLVGGVYVTLVDE